MKKLLLSIFILGLGAMVFQSCEDEIDLAPDAPDLFVTEGAAVSSTAPDPEAYNFFSPDVPITIELSTIGEDVSSFQVFKRVNDGEKVEVTTVSSFPTSISLTLREAVEGTGVMLEDLEDGDNIVISYENVQTPSGTYDTPSRTIIPVLKCPIRVPGTYDYVSTDHFCGDGPLTGTVTIEEVEPGRYVLDDFAFGTYQECYGGPAAAWGSLNWVRFTDAEACEECSENEECNSLIIEGQDNYGDGWSISVESVDGSDLTINWSNDYGEFGTVVLTRPNGSDWPPLK